MQVWSQISATEEQRGMLQVQYDRLVSSGVTPEAAADCVLRCPETKDVRWDLKGFDEGCEYFSFVTVRFLRQCLENETPIPIMQDVPKDMTHVGPVPEKCQIYALCYCWITADHPDPNLFHLKKVVAILNKDNAEDYDLVWWDWMAMPQNKPKGRRTAGETEIFKRGLQYVNGVYMHCRVKQIVQADLPSNSERVALGRTFFNCGWPCYEFLAASYCQRIVNADEELVESHLRPEVVKGLMQFETKMCTNGTQPAVITSIFQKIGQCMPRAIDDWVGFVTVCRIAKFRWLKVSFCRHLAKQGAVPFPRRKSALLCTTLFGFIALSWTLLCSPVPK